MRCDDCRDTLNAYVDGELMPEETETIRDHIASCSKCASEHETLTALSRRLKEGLERRRAPDVLKARIRGALAQPDAFEPVARPRRLPWAGLIAAGLVVAVLSSGASFAVARRNASPPSIGQQVLSSHIRSLMPGHLTDVESNDSHNVKPWFNGRVDLSPAVPRLDSAGFPLVGGRLDYVGGRPVTAVVYMRRQHVINVFSWPSDDRGSHATALSTEKGYHLVRWSDGGVEFWVASDLNVPELEQFVALFARAGSAPATK
jgi:anti-sigma factor (TIGR02949 family)